jgi:cytochrome P450
MPVFGNHLAINDKEGFVRDYTVRQVNGRMERGSDRPDILGKLFLVHKEKPSALTMANIMSVCSSNVGAGSDTTAISLRAIIWFLLTNPDKKVNLLKEIEDTAQEFGIVEAFDYQRSMKMPYLQAVIYEALRLYPAIGMALPRIVPPEGLSVGEKFIPGGVRISKVLIWRSLP